MHSKPGNTSFGEFEIDSDARILLRNGVRVPLKPKSFELLLTFVENPGRVLTKDELIEKVWKNRFIEENNLTVHVATLRRALGEKKGENRFIVTLPNEGYKFVAHPFDGILRKLTVEDSLTKTIILEEETRVRELRARTLSTKAVSVVLGGLITVVLLAGFYAVFVSSIARPERAITSVAVLPFANRSGDANTTYLSDGLAESLIYSLSRVSTLRISSRNSTFRYTGDGVDHKKAAAELDVQAIVTGSVTRRGDDLVVTAEMIDPSDNSVVWGNQFVRKATEISNLQSDLSDSIAERLRVELGVSQPGYVPNSIAYDRYLLGLYLVNKRTPDSLRKSIVAFEEAIAADPGYGQAYAGLAMSHIANRGNLALGKIEFRAHAEKEKAAALKALELDPTLAEARAVVATTLADYEWNFTAAENEFRRATESNPNLAVVRHWFSLMLSKLGRYEEALAEIKRARELDPHSRAINTTLANTYHRLGMHDDAFAEYKKLIENDPEYPWAHIMLGTAYENLGRYEDAVDPLFRGRVLMELETDESARTKVETLRRAVRDRGSEGYWSFALENELSYYRRGKGWALAVSAMHARLGDFDKTFEWLEKEFADGDPASLTYLRTEPAFEPLHEDPRFQAAVRRVGFP